MGRDIVELIEPYASDDQAAWAKLASSTLWRRLQLLLLREILVELRKLNRARAERPAAVNGPEP